MNIVKIKQSIFECKKRASVAHMNRLREKCIIMNISRHDHLYRHHIHNKQTDSLSAFTTITPHIDRLLPASRVLSS